jgi:hypothetical protein
MIRALVDAYAERQGKATQITKTILQFIAQFARLNI